MKIFTESEAVGNKRFDISNGDIVRLNDGREIVKVKHSANDHDDACSRNSGERCAFINSPLCRDMRCSAAIYLEKPVYLQLKLVGEVE